MGSTAVANPKRKTASKAHRVAASQTSAEPLPVADSVIPPLKELGLDGIGNYGGDLQFESNTRLLYEAAYGRAGTREWGEWQKLIATDEAVAAALDFVTAPIRNARLDVKAADDSKLAKDMAEFVRWNLAEQLEPSWPDFLQANIRNTLGTGFSLHELVSADCEHELLPNGRGYRLAKLSERLASTLTHNAWQENALGELTHIRQQGPRGGKYMTVDLPVERVLLTSWNRAGNNYAGVSAFRSVWYACKIREQLLKLVGISLVREGAGIPTAFTTDAKAKLTKDQRDSLIKLLQNLVYHENASVVMPAGWQMDWVFSPGANKGHVVDTFNALGLLILRVLGAQQLYLGTGDTGSRAVGSVHETSAETVVLGVVANLEGGLNGVPGRKYTGVVQRIVDPNWGPQKKYPKVTIALAKPRLTAPERAEAMAKGKAAGVFTPTFKDELVFREEIGHPPIEESEREAAKQEAVELQREQFDAAPEGVAPAKKAPFGKPAQARARLRASATEAFVPRRPLRPSERFLNLAAMAKTFDEAPESFEDGARPLVAEMLMRALPAVKRAMADRKIVGDEIAGIKLDTKRLDTFVGVYLESLRAEGYRQVFEERRKSNPRLHAASEEDDKDVPSGDDSANDEAQVVLEATRKQVVRRMVQRQLSDMEKAALDVLRTDGEPEEVVTKVLEYQAKSGAYKQDAALVTTKAFNVGRQEFAEEFGADVESCELSAALDRETCSPCDRLDGVEFEFGSAEEIEHTPPLSSLCDGGDRCRCLKIFNFKRNREAIQ